MQDAMIQVGAAGGWSDRLDPALDLEEVARRAVAFLALVVSSGAMAGEYYDMLGIVFFGMRVLVAISVINARASILAAHDVSGQQAS